LFGVETGEISTGAPFFNNGSEGF